MVFFFVISLKVFIKGEFSNKCEIFYFKVQGEGGGNGGGGGFCFRVGCVGQGGGCIYGDGGGF